MDTKMKDEALRKSSLLAPTAEDVWRCLDAMPTPIRIAVFTTGTTIFVSAGGFNAHCSSLPERVGGLWNEKPTRNGCWL